MTDLLTSLAGLAQEAAADAASYLVASLGTARETVESKSARSDLVTAVDKEAERRIVQKILKRRPQDGIIAEEGSQSTGASGLTWIIDPLDGTANYVNALPPFAVSIAVCDNVEGNHLSPIVGVLHDAAHNERYQAIKGLGATLNGAAIQTPRGDDLSVALVGTGFSHTPSIRAYELEILNDVLPRVGDLRRSGSGAVDLCWVALGRLDGFYQIGLKVWDYAAAQLIICESGAKFNLIPCDRVNQCLVLGAASLLEEPLLSVLKRAMV